MFNKIRLAVALFSALALFTAAGVAEAVVTIDATSLTGDGAVTVNAAAGSNMVLGSALVGGTYAVGGALQTGTITLGLSTAAQTVSIQSADSSTGAQIINVGNGATGANMTVNVLSGVGTAGAGILSLGNNTRVTTIGLGNIAAAAARTITIGGGNNGVVDTINIGNGNGTVAGAETINIGAGAPSGSGTNLITIGSTAAVGSALTLEAGTGNITIGNSANARTWNVGAGNAIQTVNLFSNATPANVITLGGAASTLSIGSLKNTIGIAGVANGNGVRIGASRFTVNKAVAPLDCADAACNPTVTQILDASIFTASASANRAFTLPTAQGASGLVQGLPGTPAVGDIFNFVISNSGANTVTVTAGTGATILGNAVVGAGATKLVTCRVTAITGGSETISCY